VESPEHVGKLRRCENQDSADAKSLIEDLYRFSQVNECKRLTATVNFQIARDSGTTAKVLR
jgi:hypothetical protein